VSASITDISIVNKNNTGQGELNKAYTNPMQIQVASRMAKNKMTRKIKV
jgi:hypothetical protein